jgi:hypothetical protein
MSIKAPSHLPLDTLIFGNFYKSIITSQVFGFEQIILTFASFGFMNI